MIDIKLLRDSPDIIRRNITRRFQEEKLALVDRLIENDLNWRKGLEELNDLRHGKNLLDQQIKELKSSGKAAQQQIEESRKLASRIKTLDAEVRELKESLDRDMLYVPNIAHESVPTGESEEDNVEVRRWGETPVFPFQARDHIDLGLELELFDLEKAASVAGARWYYLKNELVLLQMALMRFALDKLIEKGFIPVYPPAMIRGRVMEGAGYLPEGREDIYKIEGEDLYVVGTSEQALAGMHEGEILDEADLPIRYAGISPCFRTEVGSHGRDTKGIFRVHQFEKVEMFIFCHPEVSWEEHERMISIAEEIFRELKLPHRVVNVCTGELGGVAAKKYDIEVWLPGQGRFREVNSCSNCTDFQARRLGVRFREAPGRPTQFVHTLNSTTLASSRALIAIIENYQTSEGKIAIPDALRHYLPGMRVIERKEKGKK